MKRSGVSSTATIAGSLIVGLLIGAGAIYGLAGSLGLASTTTTTAGGGTKTVTVAETVTSTATGAACVTCLGGINGTMLLGAAQAAGNLSGTLTIGQLDDLTDGLSGVGKAIQQTTGFAIKDINA